MKLSRLFAWAGLLLISLPAFAAGTLSWVMKTPDWFQKLEVEDDNGNQQGKLTSLQGVQPVRAIVVGDQLQIDIGDRADWLKITAGNKQIRYHGRLWVSQFTDFQVFL